jgi:RHS repeat-associated protein
LPDATPHYTTYAYDNRDRVTSVTQPDGAVTRHEYVGLEIHTFDPLNTESYTVLNADGDIESRYQDDPDSPAWLRTRFEYGPFGLSTRMIAADGSAQTMRYDTLGRVDQHVDPSRGTTETSYNAFGEPVRQTNGAGEETTLRYDDLGRIKETRSPDGTATNTWDTAENGIGYLASARSADGVVTRYTYDDFGHPQTAAWTIDGEVYQLDYGYDKFGRPASLTYPQIPDVEDRLRVEYTYNTHGYLQEIRNPAETAPYWQVTSRNAEGALTEEHLGNGVVSTYGYESTTGRLTGAATTGPAGQLQKLSFDYSLNGNLISKADEAIGRVEEFGYNRLNRLLSWTVASDGGPAETLRYDYNTMGGLISEKIDGQPERDVTYRYGEDGALRHALTSRIGDGDSNSYRYDDAGRQVSGPRRRIDYNMLDLPSSVTWGQTEIRTDYLYDADGTRVRKQDGKQTVMYVGGVFERRVPAGTGGGEIHNLHYIVADGRVVAQINRGQAADGGPVIATKPWYLHADHQGSTKVVTNSAGRRVGDGEDFLNALFYDPFGRRIDADNNPLGRQRNGGVRLGFIGHEHEDETGLINMNGRIYDPQARRFLSPDPVLQDPLNSQNHNRYSYVWNNPTTYIDPSGFQTMSGTCGGASGWDCWELTAMGMADLAFPGIGNFFNPSFSLTAAPGFDEDSTALSVPGDALPDCVPECLPPGYAVNESGIIEGGNETIVVRPPGLETVVDARRRKATDDAMIDYFRDVVVPRASDDDLRGFLAKAQARGCWDPDSYGGRQVEIVKMVVEAQEAFQQQGGNLVPTLYLTEGGIATKAELAAAQVRAENEALTGNIMSAAAFAKTGDVASAKFAGSMFDLAGGVGGMAKGNTSYQLKVHGSRFPNAGPLGQPGSPDVHLWRPTRFNPGYGPLVPDPLKDYWVTPPVLNRNR